MTERFGGAAPAAGPAVAGGMPGIGGRSGRPQARPGAVPAARPWAGSPRAVALWLFVVAALVAGMVLLGGVTRLTHSGLSMVQWHPISGVVPPLDRAAWQAEFQAYQHYPEYRDVNDGMNLRDFKRIFWFEYAHRLLGRVIGVVFALPFLWFLFSRRLDRRLAPRLAGIFVLGAAQGALGWYMVESGLVSIPAVSHFRLTAHLGLAIVIFAFILWTGLELVWPGSGGARRRPGLRRGALALPALVFLQMLLGGLTAGLHAGLTDNTWPLMAGRFIPAHLFPLTPWWLNPLDTVETVQFDHRMLAYIVLISVLLVWWRVRVRPDAGRRVRIAADLVLAAVVLQVSLGIATLLEVVPVPLAAMHQGGAVLLLTTTLVLARALSAG